MDIFHEYNIELPYFYNIVIPYLYNIPIQYCKNIEKSWTFNIAWNWRWWNQIEDKHPTDKNIFALCKKKFQIIVRIFSKKIRYSNSSQK